MLLSLHAFTERHLCRNLRVAWIEIQKDAKNRENIMIIECKECKGKVSDKAAACPHCGAPVANPKIEYDPTTDYAQSQPEEVGTKTVKIILVILLMLPVIYYGSAFILGSTAGIMKGISDYNRCIGSDDDKSAYCKQVVKNFMAN